MGTLKRNPDRWQAAGASDIVEAAKLDARKSKLIPVEPQGRRSDDDRFLPYAFRTIGEVVGEVLADLARRIARGQR
jgi:hypothetical protein